MTSRISGRGFQKLGPPLSLVKKTTVFFSRSSARSLARIAPTPSSIALKAAAYVRRHFSSLSLGKRLRYFSVACTGTCWPASAR